MSLGYGKRKSEDRVIYCFGRCSEYISSILELGRIKMIKIMMMMVWWSWSWYGHDHVMNRCTAPQDRKLHINVFTSAVVIT